MEQYADGDYWISADGEDALVQDIDGGAGGGAGAAAGAHVGIARVPDARVAKLAELFQPKKITYAQVEFVDIGGMSAEKPDMAGSRQSELSWVRSFVDSDSC